MGKFVERADALHNDPTRHYNCCQAVLVPFAEETGMDHEQAYKLTANFGSGMRMGSVCGAVTGGLMALGLMGKDDPQTTAKFLNTLKDRHEGYLDCASLLRLNRDAGRPQKPHCNGMVCECAQLVEELINE